MYSAMVRRRGGRDQPAATRRCSTEDTHTLQRRGALKRLYCYQSSASTSAPVRCPSRTARAPKERGSSRGRLQWRRSSRRGCQVRGRCQGCQSRGCQSQGCTSPGCPSQVPSQAVRRTWSAIEGRGPWSCRQSAERWVRQPAGRCPARPAPSCRRCGRRRCC